jgi:hypothetical protein
MKFHLTCYFLHSIDISIHTVPLHLIHSIRFFSSILKCRAQWQKAQVFIYFRSRIIEETIIRTNSLQKAFTVVNPTIGGAKPPPLEMEILDRKVSYDLLLDERVFPAKFHCICSYRVQMHNGQTNKQTNKQTFFFIYIDFLSF